MKSDSRRQIVYDITCIWNLKIKQTSEYNKKEVIDTLENDLDNAIGNDFNPRKIMDNYVASVSENGFNLQDVLNPGELELEDICKELGLIEEE